MQSFKKPSPSMVVAAIALFVALSGGAYAGVALNQVRSANIKNGEVKTADLANFAVTAVKMANSSVKSNKIVDGTILSQDIADGAVFTPDLGAGAVTPAKISQIPAARVTSSVNTTVPSGAFTAIPMNTERFDAMNMHRTDADTSRLTATTAGIYMVSANVTWAPNGTGARELNVRKNGATIVARVVQPGDAVNTADQSATTLVQLNAGDFVEIVVRQNSGAPLGVATADDYSPLLSAAWMAPA